jgi:class 3 adenylate cyclase/tetratricopeptide (TPR) repeat protein
MPDERKLVTILFADVTDSTALGDGLDPEDVRALMGRYYSHARRIVAAHGGTLEKFIGDAVMAVFGLPRAHGDDAERALAAALALCEAVTGDELLGPSFLLRFGVNTGEVVATSDPSGGDFLVTGDAANVAARLQQHANPGEIIVGERTMHAAQTAFLFGEARCIEVKGKQQALQVFPLKGARPARKIDRPPLVGRRQDLLQLSLLQARVLEELRPQLVSIVAPAGTGKTRLLEEFLSRLDPADGFQVTTARCLPYGQTLTYWPLRGLLTDVLGEEITAERLRAVFGKGGYNREDAARLADLVLTTLGIEGEKTMDRESIFMAWRLLIEVFAQQAPRIMIFEDLHWASDSLLDLVEYITYVRAQIPLLLIALSRPELLDRRPTWGGGRQNFTALALQPLTAVQTRDLVARLMQDIPQATRERIVERSGGNPFFALELVRGLNERGLTGASATLDTLPDTVHAAVLARLDQLSKQGRAILQVASVAGRAFTSSMLGQVLHEYSRQEIEAALDELLARDLIAPGEAGSFTFRHILIRDVAYGTLSRTERIRLHERIATSLEASAGEKLDEYIELIAYHYREAVMLARQSVVRTSSPVEAGRAIHFLRRAALLASRAGAFAEAQTYLQSAIALAPEAELAALSELLGDSIGWTITAIDAYQKALEYWRKNDTAHPVVGARLLRKLLIHYTRGGGSYLLGGEHLSAWMQEAQQLAEQAGDEDEQWRIRIVDLFLSKTAAGLSREALEEKRRVGLAAAAYFEQKGDWAACSEALDGYGAISRNIGAYHDALAVALRRLNIPDLPAMEYGDALAMAACAYEVLEDYGNCIGVVEQVLQALRPGQPIVHLGQAIAEVIGAAFRGGHWRDVDRLKPRLEEVREQTLYDSKASILLADGYLNILEMALAREDRATVDATASVLMRIFAVTPTTAEYLSNAGALVTLFLTEDMSQVEATFSSNKAGLACIAMTFCSERDMPATKELIAQASSIMWMPTGCQVAIAQALADGDDARLEQAIDEAEAHQLVVHAARMRIVLARHTGDRKQLARARCVLEQLGDRQFLRRLEDVEAALSDAASEEKVQ